MKTKILVILMITLLTSCFVENKEGIIINNDIEKEIINKNNINNSKNNPIENNNKREILIESKSGTTIIEDSSNENTNTWDLSFWQPLQDFINELMKNPDKLKNEDCSLHNKEVMNFCIEKQNEYLKILN